MDFRSRAIGRIPKLTRITRPEDLDEIEFVDGLAEVEVPIELLESVPLKHAERLNSPRLDRVVQSIRSEGYSSLEPIVCRVGALGNWVVIDGGHRITAAKRVSQEFFTNLFGGKVGDLTFILFQTPMSYSKLRPKIDIESDGPDRDHRVKQPSAKKRKHRKRKKK
jgi:ParB/Sulfiredoxin domain